MYANVSPDGALDISIGTHHLPTCFLRAGLCIFSDSRPSLIDILENITTANTELSRVWEEKTRLYAIGMGAHMPMHRKNQWRM